MADNTAQIELARRTQKFRKDKLKSDYKAYLGQLAQQYGISQESLASNLEARGILRSGEAGTAVTRLAATDQANRTNARSDYVYNRDATKIDLLQQLAALQSGAAAPATTATQTTAPVVPDPIVPVAPPIAVAPTDIGNGQTYANTGLYGVVYPTPGAVKPRPIRDQFPRPPRPIITTPRPGTVTFNPIHPRFR